MMLVIPLMGFVLTVVVHKQKEKVTMNVSLMMTVQNTRSCGLFVIGGVYSSYATSSTSEFFLSIKLLPEEPPTHGHPKQKSFYAYFESPYLGEVDWQYSHLYLILATKIFRSFKRVLKDTR